MHDLGGRDCRVGVMADNGVTYNSSVTYQHAIAHNPDVRTHPTPNPPLRKCACQIIVTFLM